MPASSRLAAFKRWLWLLNRRRLHRRELARQIQYPDWCAKYDALTDAQLMALRQRFDAMPSNPAIDLRMPLKGAPLPALRATVHSLQAQIYGHWRLTLFDNTTSTDPATVAWAESLCASDLRIQRGAGSESANGALSPSPSPSTSPSTSPSPSPSPSQAQAQAQSQEPAVWWGDLSAGDLWRPHALLLLAEAALHHPTAQMLYADHDTGHAAARYEPAFKCDWNAELLWSHDYLGAPVLWHVERYERLGLVAITNAHERALRGSIGLAADEVVHVPHVLVHQAARVPHLNINEQAVQRHLKGLGQTVETSVQADGLKLRFAAPEALPRASIIIPTRNGLDLLRTCITSLLQTTDYANFDITVVDNGTDDAACLVYLQSLAKKERIQVLRDDRPFNYAQLNNGAVQQCQGEYLVLLNNDIEIINGDWLREMLSLAALPDVGAVGARLLYGDRSVQHAGVILGIGGGAGHVHKRLGEFEGGYLGRGLQLQCLSAVTAACLLVRRDHYLAVGGLDAESFAVAFNDIDFCLRLQAHGLRNLYTPHAVLLHHESVSRGKDNDRAKRPRFEAERERFVQRWGHLLTADPAYNPNLTLQAESFGLADPPRVSLLKPWFNATTQTPTSPSQHAHPSL
jgi:O-antigen biosynthesis protein